jgi:hypothetical protein
MLQTPDLYSYVVHKLYTLVEEDTSQLPLVHVAIWCIGEFGEVCPHSRACVCWCRPSFAPLRVCARAHVCAPFSRPFSGND